MKKFLIAAFTLLLLPFVLAASQDVFLSSDVSLNLAPPEVIISEFITETKDMKDLPEYNDKYKYFYNNSISLIKQKFIKLGKSEDEWEEMSLY